MTGERWKQIEELYHAARERGRGALEGTDPDLRQEVERLLSEDSGGKLLDGAAADLLSQTISGISTGTQLGPYRIEAPIGVGGMGQVYRATDTRLGRSVAIKTSKSQFSERFEREAIAISALNHPHICTLYDVGPNYLVMELVEGETLATRLKRGKLSPADALTCGIQIAGALAAAHARGIIHRDLKPGNIMLTKSGAKLLDFGLAKRTRAADTSSIATDLTGQGALLGTVPYMAPEQIEGKEADARSDIFAFGAVLYEMLSGMRPFPGETNAHVMAAILEHEPPSLSDCPSGLSRIVSCCLVKDPEQRWQSARDLKAELEWSTDVRPAEHTPRRSQIVPWFAAAIATLLALILAVLYVRHPQQGERTIRFQVAPPESNQSFGFHALSPDGQWLAFIAAAPGTDGQLFVRKINATAAQALTAAPMAGEPFWSPDSRWIAFFTGDRLMKISPSGGSPQTICDAPGPYAQGTWNSQGVILFDSGLRSGIFRVAAAGGKSEPLLLPDPSRQELGLSSPKFLPDGRNYIFFVNSGAENRGVYLSSLNSKERKRILSTDSNAVYAYSLSGPAHLLFIRGKTLVAQRFDEQKLELQGDAEPVAEGVAGIRLANLALPVLSASGNGMLAYREGTVGVISELVWFDRYGKRLSVVGDPAEYDTLALSPDESKVIAARMNAQLSTHDLWLFNLKAGVSSRFTFDPADEINPAWSPDGRRVVFASSKKGPYDILQKASGGTTEVESLLESKEKKFPYSWSPDGRFILYGETGNLWALPVTGGQEPHRLLEGVGHAEVSPNGRWVAYHSLEGNQEIYVQSVTPTGGKSQVSTAGGSEAHWSKDGMELFYIAPGSKLMTVEVDTNSETFRSGTSKLLFGLPPVPAGGRRYSVAANGQRFLAITPIQTPASPITVVTNWTSELRK
jgi:serine/threonine protein kinase/WD40 repeat protein